MLNVFIHFKFPMSEKLHYNLKALMKLAQHSQKLHLNALDVKTQVHENYTLDETLFCTIDWRVIYVSVSQTFDHAVLMLIVFIQFKFPMSEKLHYNLKAVMKLAQHSQKLHLNALDVKTQVHENYTLDETL